MKFVPILNSKEFYISEKDHAPLQLSIPHLSQYRAYKQ